MISINKYLSNLKAEIVRLGIFFVPKRKHWSLFIWKAMSAVTGRDYTDSYYVAAFWGKALLCPGNSVLTEQSAEVQACIGGHEIQHFRDKWGLNAQKGFFARFWWSCLYLFSKEKRGEIEARGFIRTMESLYIVYGDISERDINFIIEALSGDSYFRMWTKDRATKWTRKMAKMIKERERPFPKSLPEYLTKEVDDE